MPESAFKRDVVKPVHTFQSYRTHIWHWYFPVPFAANCPTVGTAPEDFGKDVLGAGYSAYFYDGVGCKEAIDHIYRGGLVFDLSPYQKLREADNFMLLRATLQLSRNTKHVDPVNTHLCLATANWVDGVLDNGLIPTSLEPEDYVATIEPYDPTAPGFHAVEGYDVTREVVDWIIGYRPNFGFALVGDRETMPKKEDSMGLNAFSHFELEMVYLSEPSMKKYHDFISPFPRPFPKPSLAKLKKGAEYSMTLSNIPQALQDRQQYQPNQCSPALAGSGNAHPHQPTSTH